MRCELPPVTPWTSVRRSPKSFLSIRMRAGGCTWIRNTASFGEVAVGSGATDAGGATGVATTQRAN